MTVVWTRLALADLDSACDYIAEERPGSAATVIDRIEKAIEILRRHPEIGRPGRVAGTRELLVPGTPFMAAYRVNEKRVEVLSLIHGARRWPDEL
ncbi:MAG: type II toxin-antitoxin system RelE/ParE family toxin [Elusimicrobiota bacterium]